MTACLLDLTHASKPHKNISSAFFLNTTYKILICNTVHWTELYGACSHQVGTAASTALPYITYLDGLSEVMMQIVR